MFRHLARVGLAAVTLAVWPRVATETCGEPMHEGVVLFLGPVAQALPVGTAFEAEYEEVETDPSGGPPKQVLFGRVFVDRDGRIRNEDRTAGVVQIVDPRARTMTQRDLRTGRVRFRMPMPAIPPPAMAGASTGAAPAATGAPTPTHEDLGEREIEGLVCSGSRFRFERGGVAGELESWRSRDLGLILRSRRVADGRERTFALTKMRRGDPDPKLFASDE